MTAWKDHERRICRMWGGERRGPLGKECSDCIDTPVALEVKRSKSMSIRSAWIAQTKRNAKKEEKPWVLVVAGHGDRSPIAVCDHGWLVSLFRRLAIATDSQLEQVGSLIEAELARMDAA